MSGSHKQLRVAICVLVCAPAVYQLWLATHVFVARYDYAFDIDWLESASLYQAWRMMEGQFTYDAPERGYLPLFHPIGYPAVLAGFGKVFGLDYAMARILSFGAFVATMLIGGAAVIRHASDRIAGYMLAAVSIGLVAAGLPLAGGFYDMVRNDTLSWLMCAVAAAVATKEKLSHRRIALLAAVMIAGVYVRLLTVFPCAWIGLLVLLRDRRAGLRLAAYVIGGCVAVLSALQLSSGGWYFTYTVTVLQRHAIHPDRILSGVWHILEHQPIAPLVPLAALALHRVRALSLRGKIWSGVFAMAIPASLLPFGKDGGYFNDFMPLGLFVGPAVAVLIIDGARWVKHDRLATFGPYAAGAALAIFLALTPIDAGAFIPSAEHVRRATALNELVASLEGGVIAPCHPFLAIRNGHRNDQYSEMPYLDAYWSKMPGLALGQYIDDIDAEWIFLTNFEIDDSLDEVVARYEPARRMVNTPATIVGQSMHIRYLLRRKHALKNPRVVFDFEAGETWPREGDAFEHSPTITRPLWQSPIRGASGNKLANSYHPKLGDRARGSVTSPSFVIDRDSLALDIGGGVGVGVTLIVDGRGVAAAFPTMQDREILLRTTLDVSAFRGRKAQLKLYDENTENWGHVVVDNVVLFDP